MRSRSELLEAAIIESTATLQTPASSVQLFGSDVIESSSNAREWIKTEQVEREHFYWRTQGRL